MSLMDFLPLSDEELVQELRTMANTIRDDAYANESYDLAFNAHVLFSALERLRDNDIPAIVPVPMPKHQHFWKIFQGWCICTVPGCWKNRHPYGMFDDCGEHE